MIGQKELLQRVLPLMEAHGKVYRKHKHVFAKKAIGGEAVQTVTADGLETSNTASKGDFIVKNQTGAAETYILPEDKFKARYAFLKESEDGFSEYIPTGVVHAIEMTPTLLKAQGWPNEFHFEAPWGEQMVVKKNDFLACPPELNEVYRIARKEFYETYREKP